MKSFVRPPIVLELVYVWLSALPDTNVWTKKCQRMVHTSDKKDGDLLAYIRGRLERRRMRVGRRLRIQRGKRYETSCCEVLRSSRMGSTSTNALTKWENIFRCHFEVNT